MMKYFYKLQILIICLMIFWPAVSITAIYTVDMSGSINDAVAALQPGDTLLVRDGTYRETITIRVNGSADNPITIKNYPDELPVLDGSEIVSGWSKCESSEDCEGNKNWENIYYAYAPAGTAVFSANLYQNDEMLSISQYPNPSDPFYMDNKGDYLSVPPSNITNTSIIDSRLEEIGGEKLVGSYVAVWIQPNSVVFKKTTDYIAAEHKLLFEDVGGGGPYTDRDSYYSILNSLNGSVLDKPGEYMFNETPESDGTHKIFVWPLNNLDLSAEGEITISVRTGLVHFGDSNYITVEGFKIQKGIGRIIRTGWGTSTGNIIKNNEITKCRAANTSNMIYMFGSNNIIIENNYLHYNAGRSRGVVLNGDNVVVRNNTIINQGGTCIYFGGVNKGKIINNTIRGSRGSHSNGITTYQGCSDILVAGNKVINSNIAFTMQASSNITLYNNLFHGADNTGYVVANWGGMTGTIAALNNTVFGSNNNASIHMGTADRLITKNNILDGGGGGERSHNIYTSLSWSQRPFYDWYPAEGEIIADGSGEYDIYDIFVNPDNYDFRLKESSIAIDAGTDVADIIDSLGLRTNFPDFNFNVDIEGNSRPQSSGWDIGAYEYGISSGIPQPPDPPQPPEPEPPEPEPEPHADIPDVTSLKVSNNIIKKSGNTSATIQCNLKEAGNLTVKIYDAKGREIITLCNEHREADSYTFSWSGKDSDANMVGSGIYVVHMKIGSYEKIKKIAVVR